MRKTALGLLAALSLASAAYGQTFPQTLPPNTLVGRLGGGPGPSEAIPMATLGLPAAANVLPGLTGNVAGIGQPGFDFSGCNTSPTCGLFYFNGNPTVASLNFPLLRVQRNSTNNFSGGGGLIPNVLEVLEDTSRNQAAASFTFLAQLNNHTDGVTNAANVAITGQGFKQAGLGDTNEIGTTWGAVLNCQDFQGKVNPAFGCLGAEISVAVKPGGGTDTAKQRIGLLIPFQTTDGSFDSGIHIGYGLIMTANSGVVIDNALVIQDTNAIQRFYVGGGGTTLITNGTTNIWSAQLISLVPDLGVCCGIGGVGNIAMPGQAIAPALYGYRFNGTMASPTAVAQFDVLAQIGARGFYTAGAAFTVDSSSMITFPANENWTDNTHNGADITFSATPAGSGVAGRIQVLSVLGAGNLRFRSAGNFSANGSVATVLGSLGPVGSHTTVQKWLTIVDNTGATLWIPAF